MSVDFAQSEEEERKIEKEELEVWMQDAGGGDGSGIIFLVS